MAPDRELVAAFATEASETAFQTLVARHVDLVYATALRQVGDPGWAEEITQNVFIILARKAPRLGRLETIGGWLHRTAILESKARLRAELRRRRREEVAAENISIQVEGSSPFAPLLPLLDEALLDLRDADRSALVLRFFEARSLREIGETLGVQEEAARKRIARALDRIAEFFQERGVSIPATSSAAALLTHAVQAAPASLVNSITQASVAAAGSSATAINLLALQFMTFTKAHIVLIGLFVAAAPLLWQTGVENNLQRQQTDADENLRAARFQLAAVEADVLRERADLAELQKSSGQVNDRLNSALRQLDGQSPVPAYRWDDSSEVARVPKKFLQKLDVTAVRNGRGEVTRQIKEILQMTEGEAQSVQAALDNFLREYNAALAKAIRPVQPNPRELQGHSEADTRVFEVPSLQEHLRELRPKLFAQLESALGPERFAAFQSGLRNWMPLDDERQGFNTGMAIFDVERRVVVYRPEPGARLMAWGFTAKNGSMSAALKADEIPDAYRNYLQDWISLALSEPPGK